MSSTYQPIETTSYHLDTGITLVDDILVEGGVITIITKNGQCIAKGMKIVNNLYKMEFKVCKPQENHFQSTTASPQTFVAAELAQS